MVPTATDLMLSDSIALRRKGQACHCQQTEVVVAELLPSLEITEVVCHLRHWRHSSLQIDQ